MSETVYYRGKLFLLRRLEGESLIQQCERLCKQNNIKHLPKYTNSWKECVKDELYERYYINNENIYSIKKNEVNLDEDIFKAKENEYGVIEFEVKYYNGGCGFSEALDEALENMEK